MTDANPSGDRDEPKEKPAPGVGIGLNDHFIVVVNIVPRSRLADLHASVIWLASNHHLVKCLFKI